MTAPAEDPRGGEVGDTYWRTLAATVCRCGHRAVDHQLLVTENRTPCCLCSCGEYVTPPAAGRGDSGGGGECRHVGKAGLDCDCEPAPPAARPAGDRAQPTQEVRGIHTACDKRIRVERGEHGTKIHLTEPERGLGTTERTMWANLSPRDVHELVAALESATPRLDDLLAAEATVGRVRVLIDHPGLPDATCRKLVRRALDGTT